jgi:hypothetical protein
MQSPCHGYALPEQCTQSVIGRDEASGSEAFGRSSFELLTCMIQKSIMLFFAFLFRLFRMEQLYSLFCSPLSACVGDAVALSSCQHPKLLKCFFSFLQLPGASSLPSCFLPASTNVTFLDEESGSKAFGLHRPDFVLQASIFVNYSFDCFQSNRSIFVSLSTIATLRRRDLMRSLG